MKLQVTTKVIDGRITRNRKTLQNALKQFDGKEITLTIEKTKRTRSNQQNRWYWGVAVMIVYYAFIDLGQPRSKEQVHELLKMAAAKDMPHVMLEEVVIESTGVVLQTIKSTAELTTSEFMEYKLFIQQWASENLDVIIPDPNEQLEIQQ